MPESLTIAQARDAMNGLVNNAVLIAYPDPATRPLLIWPDGEGIPPDDSQKPWLQVIARHGGGGQASLAGASGTQRFRRTGLMAIQINTPKGDGNSTSDSIAGMILSALERPATTTGVWFRNVRPLDIGVRGAWYRFDVLADFEYDEIK